MFGAFWTSVFCSAQSCWACAFGGDCWSGSVPDVWDGLIGANCDMDSGVGFVVGGENCLSDIGVGVPAVAIFAIA